ncbi:hypothetical protein ACSYAY_01450 [Leptospirillum ferriphilum]|jgi:cation:H+ antiporter|uniref:Ca2+/Na+ antiporter n=2 Tax=Leptospirillum TaxID=179 RepID=A0A094WF45_9BACT|nr:MULTISPECIES: sodium/calcium exchanger membrane region [Leptospirillum]AKS22804.1 hypothetical protein ABH19_02115 [Leptospirillum sp. Group II 'CF-1']EDZ39443.1 MAG: Probable sodium/calcium exchanger membrane region [Leptospirillum sp. Group II '5-way CG']EIJ77012.1 MAG: putative sodium/calcium exchanger membrane region [Leptospirillum sp. Group II 'C75']KGA95155.1 Ca2+/Na+ antiporter [Leptospirillum ferriphilum]
MTTGTGSDILTLLVGFSLILTGSVLFSRTAEHLVETLFRGHPLGMRVLGILSLSLPEALLPLMAFWSTQKGFSHSQDASLEIGVGAILGAPSFLLLLLWPFYLFRTGRPGKNLPQSAQLRREIPALVVALAIALLAGMTHSGPLHLAAAAVLLLLFLFSLSALRSDPADPPAPPVSNPSRLFLETALFLGASVLIVAGPRVFLAGLFDWQNIHPGPAPFWVSMVLSALATESPEALALFFLLQKGERNHAFQIVWGAIGFQLTIPPAIGLVLSPWNLTLRHDAMGFVLLAVLVVSWGTARQKP